MFGSVHDLDIRDTRACLITLHTTKTPTLNEENPSQNVFVLREKFRRHIRIATHKFKFQLTSICEPQFNR